MDPGSTYSIDLPDGTIIHGICATWLTRPVSGATCSYPEGAASGSLVQQTGAAAPAGDLVLSCRAP
jgi:hypothetical protein